MRTSTNPYQSPPPLMHSIPTQQTNAASESDPHLVAHKVICITIFALSGALISCLLASPLTGGADSAAALVSTAVGGLLCGAIGSRFP